LLVVDADGNVLYQDSLAGMRIQNINGALLTSDSPILTSYFQGKLGCFIVGKQCISHLASLSQASGLISIQIAGTDSNSTSSLCRLVQAERSRPQAGAVRA